MRAAIILSQNLHGINTALGASRLADNIS